ncbi:hypothetical protein KKB44_05845 [Candidatus Micrarchaeota archaeon]|nr:hypothetical protein [Candidatus Micrarchaeota archaeon]
MMRLFVLALVFLLSLSYAEIPEDTTKAVILYLNIKGDTITVLDKEIIYNYPPEHFVEYPFINVEALTASGISADRYGIMDPRLGLIHGENIEEDHSAMMLDEANFTLILPFYENMKTVEFTDNETGVPMGSVDLSQEIYEFCSENEYQDPDCQKMDLDNDGKMDYEDDCPLEGDCGEGTWLLMGALVILAIIGGYFLKDKLKH